MYTPHACTHTHPCGYVSSEAVWGLRTEMRPSLGTETRGNPGEFRVVGRKELLGVGFPGGPGLSCHIQEASMMSAHHTVSWTSAPPKLPQHLLLTARHAPDNSPVAFLRPRAWPCSLVHLRHVTVSHCQPFADPRIDSLI